MLDFSASFFRNSTDYQRVMNHAQKRCPIRSGMTDGSLGRDDEMDSRKNCFLRRHFSDDLRKTVLSAYRFLRCARNDRGAVVKEISPRAALGRNDRSYTSIAGYGPFAGP